MKRPQHDLIVLLKDDFLSETAMAQQLEYLNAILRITESPEQFCTAHELVNRNKITSQPAKILKAVRTTELKPFRFLINKN